MKLFLIADNHFGDYDGPDDVIHIFHRPFKDSLQMNAAMIERWNKTVTMDDVIFSLGDFAWCNNDFQKYSPMLNGHIIFLQGNHDFEHEDDGNHFPAQIWLIHKGEQFLLIHDPDQAPEWWKGWTIHGHHHWMPQYPFISEKYKTVNVACEQIDYTPIELDQIITKIKSGNHL